MEEEEEGEEKEEEEDGKGERKREEGGKRIKIKILCYITCKLYTVRDTIRKMYINRVN